MERSQIREVKRNKWIKAQKKDKRNHYSIIEKGETSVENYSGEIKDADNCTSTKIITQIVGKLQLNQKWRDLKNNNTSSKKE